MIILLLLYYKLTFSYLIGNLGSSAVVVFFILITCIYFMYDYYTSSACLFV